MHHAKLHVPTYDFAAQDLVLEDASARLTQREILAEWPDDLPRPDQTTTARLLRHAVTAGRIRQEGTGRKNDPYHYWLKDREEDVHPGPGATHGHMQRWIARYTTKWLASLDIQEAEPDAARLPAQGTDAPCKTFSAQAAIW